MLICLLVLVLLSGALYNGGVIAETLNVKIVEIPQHSRYFPSINTDPPKALVTRAPPAEVSGPPHLRLLNGLCFKTKEKTYLYEFCPFHNVTQIEDKIAWNRYQGILGVWRQWIVEGDRFVGMHFAMGDQCGRTERRVDVIFQCSTTSELTNITEPRTCNYRIVFRTPLACFRGAMQVYRVLTEQEIQLWDSFTEEYVNDELTSLGLKRRQDELLLKAGLLYNFTKDELLKATPTQPSSHLASKKERVSCEQRVTLLEQQLADLKEELGAAKWVMSRDPVMVAAVQRMLGNRTRSITVNVTEPPSLQSLPSDPTPPVSDQPTTRAGGTDDIDNPVRPDNDIALNKPDTHPGDNPADNQQPDLNPAANNRDLNPPAVNSDTNPPADNLDPGAVNRDVNPPAVNRDSPAVNSDLNPPAVNRDVNPPADNSDTNPPADNLDPGAVNRDVNPPAVNRDSPAVNSDLNPPAVNRDVNPPAVNRDVNPPADNRDSPVENRDPPAVNRDSPADNRDPPADNRDSPVDNRDSPAYNHDPAVENQPPDLNPNAGNQNPVLAAPDAGLAVPDIVNADQVYHPERQQDEPHQDDKQLRDLPQEQPAAGPRKAPKRTEDHNRDSL